LFWTIRDLATTGLGVDTSFFFGVGRCVPVVGGGQTRAGSLQGGSVPPMRFEDEEICFGRSGIWPPPVWGSIPRFFSVLGVASPLLVVTKRGRDRSREGVLPPELEKLGET
jgi:hypothetical protein